MSRRLLELYRFKTKREAKLFLSAFLNVRKYGSKNSKVRVKTYRLLKRMIVASRLIQKNKKL